MSVLAEAAQYLAFAVLITLTFYVAGRLIAAMQQRYVRGETSRYEPVLLSVVVWGGLFLSMWPITEVLDLALLAVAVVLIPAVQIALGWAVPKALRVRPTYESSMATAQELIGVRHPRLAQIGRVDYGRLVLPGLLLAGLIVVVVDPADRQTWMFRAVFATLFAGLIPVAAIKAVLLTMPVLDDNSRDSQLALGIAGMVFQLFALGLLLSSLDVPRTDIPLAVGGLELSISIPILAGALAYFALGTAVPYAFGVRASRRLREDFAKDEESIRQGLENLLVLPTVEVYAAGLGQLKQNATGRIEELEANYFYLNLRAQSPEEAASTVGGPMSIETLDRAHSAEARQIDDPAAIVEALGKEPVDLPPVPRLLGGGEGNDEGGEGEIVASITEPLESDSGDDESVATIDERLAPSGHESRSGEIVTVDEEPLVRPEDRSYAELLRQYADERGLSNTDPRRSAFQILAYSFEREARAADPTFIHCDWMRRIRSLIERVEHDLTQRASQESIERAAGRWSQVAARQAMPFAGSTGDTTSRPRALVIITAIGGLAITGVIRAAVTIVWDVFSSA